MTCHCGRPALRKVGTEGYCREHLNEAQAKQADVIRDREFSASEYEACQNIIERRMRMGAERFRTKRQH